MLVLRGVADGEVSGVISNGPVTTALSLSKGDSGKWTLAATNLYTGSTYIFGGTLLVNGLVGGAMVTNSGGVLGGTGTINAPVYVAAGATLAPGASIGTLTINNALVLNGTTAMEVGKLGGMATNDSVRGLTSVTYGGTLNVTLTGALGGGEVFKLFEAGSYGGAFSAINLPALPSGIFWNTDYLNIDGTLRIDGSAPTPPQISRIALSGTAVVISGTGGAAGASYHVLTSTNVALPIVAWTPVATNTFGPGGVFSFTNAVSPNSLQRFYMLVVP